MAISGGRAMFLTAVDCSGDEKTGLFISELLIKAMEHVGIYNVVQVLTDNAPNSVRAGEIIEDTHPHISWSGCMAHILSLLMKDIGNSKIQVLQFVGQTYAKAKTTVDYIRNHSMIRYIFKKFSALEVVQAKKTRFGSHYFLLSRIVRVRSQLLSMVLSEEWDGIKKGRSKKVEHGMKSFGIMLI
ncbi:hypothetical protein ACHQM5_007202 [Ranunculus cassubicifolius]